MRYIVKRDYKSHVGEYRAGQIIEIADPEYAAWLARDMGGYLEAIAQPPLTEQPERVSKAAPVVETHMLEMPGPGVEVHVARPARKGRGRKNG